MNLRGKLITRCGWSSVIAKRCDSTKKLLYTIFWNSEDHVVKVADQSPDMYTYIMCSIKLKTLRKEVIKALNLQHSILHNSVLAHKSQTVRFISWKKKKLMCLPHHPYSLDFILFSKVKKALVRKKVCFKISFGSAIYQYTIINVPFLKTLYERISCLDKSVEVMRVC